MDSNFFQGSPSSRRICKYDVFLSFRGDDTRKKFTDHLYNHLVRKGIFTFMDDKRLEEGQLIPPQLLQAIRDSRVSIVIFSRNYAASTWCLDEMAAIVDCHKELKQIVFPVFYDVDPSHVRKQDGAYEDAFAMHTERFKEDPDKVDRWKRALVGLANTVGWDVRDKPEFGEIENIVQKVIKTLNHKFSRFADDLIGIQSGVERLEKLLKLSSKDDDFRVFGILGMGGIGKTTHATVLYDKISYQFDACCFIENVSKIYKDGGAMAVQKQILRQTLDEKNLEMYSPCETSGIITSGLHNLKVLVVLDNVDQLEQLEELAINPKLLGAGSRIIITTRDEHVVKVYGAKEVYKVPLLNNDDARELLHSKAFKRVRLTNDYKQLIPKVLKYVQSLPLAIKVVGSFLCTRDVTQWRDALDRLENNPENKVMDALQISFEGLRSDEKKIFLHISCFFRGERVDYVKRILRSCGFHPDIGISVITEKSLITIRNQEIHMHEMLYELGKKIVRQQFPREPRLWSRLWLYQDFHNVLMTEVETNNVEAIVLDRKEDVFIRNQLRAEGLSKMRRLRLLILYQENFEGSFNNLSNSLQYLLWHGYPFASLPLNYEPYNSLMELNMPNSSIQRLWEGRKRLACLKRMDMSNSKYLMETPNFEWSPHLERLDFAGCINLRHVHSSIGLLKQLLFLSFRNCSNLVRLDLGTKCGLCCLRVLHLSGCTNLESTPDFTGLSNLEYLDLECCSSLSEVHKSIAGLESLKFLSLKHCTNLGKICRSFNRMRSLITLDLCGCVKLGFSLWEIVSCRLESLIFLDLGFRNLSEVPNAIGNLSCLERLNLEGNNIASLPVNISRLSSLAYLNLSHCKKLRYFPRLPSKSGSSVGRYFKSVSGSRNQRSGLYALNCPSLTYEPHWSVSLDDLVTDEQVTVFSWLARLAQEPRHFRCGFDIVAPGTKIPNWFDHVFDPCSLIRIVHSDVDDNWIGFAFCVVFNLNYCPTNSGSTHNNYSSQLSHPLYLSFESEHVEECFHMPVHLKLDEIQDSKQEHLWLIYISRVHCHFVKTGACITFKANSRLNIRKWGFLTVFEQDIEAQKIELNGIGVMRQNKRLKIGKANQVDRPAFVYVRESYSSSGPKIQLPYNGLVTEEEENEKMEAEQKENYISNMGL